MAEDPVKKTEENSGRRGSEREQCRENPERRHTTQRPRKPTVEKRPDLMALAAKRSMAAWQKLVSGELNKSHCRDVRRESRGTRCGLFQGG